MPFFRVLTAQKDGPRSQEIDGSGAGKDRSDITVCS